MRTLSNYNEILLGYNDNEPIYLKPPSWDCGWYWGFGYLGNENCHYHIDGLMKKSSLYDGFKNHFGNTFIIKESDIWLFSELFKTFYMLKETANILKSGSANYTTNPIKELIINSSEVERINNIVLPQLFEEIYKVINRNLENPKLFEKLASFNL